METIKLKTLLELSSQNEFCIQNEDGHYLALTENVEGKIKSVISCLGLELFGKWPLDEQEELLFKTLTSLKYRPSKRVSKKKKPRADSNN